MRLERLEISGFKSFSDRAELAFDRGVTAIVGPNGCGKSNVADAITWVLGEQSAKSLRGEKMEDVIFGGSDARKAGAAAEVRLRLSGLPAPANLTDVATTPLHEFQTGGDNGHTNGNGHNGNGHADEHAAAIQALAAAFTRDVEVTRRLYRSGESEYLIDGETCRLKDVHELLMDTGLGAKAYAIIEQGKIGMILSSRPTDRRQLIEEAAGITKYKSRRRSAELKLEAAQQNLTRFDDIVYEVEGKMVVEKEGDYGIGSNVDDEAEEGAAGDKLESGEKKVINIVSAHQLNETPFDKKSYMAYIKAYMGRVKKHLEDNNPSRVGPFQSAAQAFIKKVIGSYDDYSFYTGSSMDPEALVALMFYRPDGTTPVFYFFKDGLQMEKY